MIQRFARPYARALLARTSGIEAAKQARDELDRFCRALEAVPGLGRMAQNPAIPMAVKEQVVDEVAATLGLGELVVSLLRLLLTHYRLLRAGAVLAAVDQILMRRLGTVSAQVTSAEPLDAAQRERLETVLGRVLERKVDLEVSVAPELLAGFVVHVESRRYDASLRGQLERLAAALAESGGGAGS